VNKSEAASFKDKKDYILLQRVERGWSNSSNTNNIPSAANETSAFASIMKSLKSGGRNAIGGNNNNNQRANVYHHQRTNSLCVFYNAGILSTGRNGPGNENKRLGPNENGYMPPRDVKILQYHEKIMEAQNKWTGNGQFFIRKKASFVVSSLFFNLFKTTKINRSIYTNFDFDFEL
jgi:hypothetical protein